MKKKVSKKQAKTKKQSSSKKMTASGVSKKTTRKVAANKPSKKKVSKRAASKATATASKRGPRSTRPPGAFGGEYFKNYHPRMARPIDESKALKIELRSSQAVGAKSFKNVKFKDKIWSIIRTHAQNNGIRISQFENHGNRLELLVRCKERDAYKKFIRVITGLIARVVGGSERGHKLKKRFWDSRPLTLINSR